MSRLVQAVVKPLRAAPTTARVSFESARQSLGGHAIPQNVYSDLLGKPFAPSARGPESFDCVGIALEIAKRLGKQLPAFVSSEAELHAQLGAGNASLADLPQIARPVPGCIVLLRISPSEHHVAFMIDEYRMIHTMKGINCSIERINSSLWQRRVIGFYRL